MVDEVEIGPDEPSVLAMNIPPGKKCPFVVLKRFMLPSKAAVVSMRREGPAFV
jgi:hypothetical protein